MTPHNPPSPWTATAPPGSSTYNFDSNHGTVTATNAPAAAPMVTAAEGMKKGHPAEDATRPATQPFAASEASGLPKRARVTARDAKPADNPDREVLTPTSATTPGSLPAKSIAPAEFNPSQPIHAARHPIRTKTPLWPGIAVGVPSSEYFPRRGPRIHATASAVTPPTA